MTELEKMQLGVEFDPDANEIQVLRHQTFTLIQQFNRTFAPKGRALAKKIFAKVGSQTIITPPFLCEFGKTISIGDRCFINMGVTMLDNAPITIGNNVLIGPSSQLYTASHPLDFKKRRQWECCNLPIVVEDDVWIGGNVVICQGVTIGARSVVAAGAVVTKDVAPDTLVAGVPAKMIKHIESEHDNNIGE
ncbi:sugar O-acetyltransferase [Motilimonas cestriensis]|uniref:Sugar O-acetyltransferase n=1 Tax=Motilimonas cestriensis TaxID=2742685 RepID=A0ABS8WCE1_9GAMM|nr:sugar O-acetyltransferase [Motilimonas cestriensis]MCE2595997.1 sugar O-acetyltransferase [Motilimonas cestriensis]